MKIIVINGVNLKMLGLREPDIYGTKTYSDLISIVKKHAKSKNVKVKFFQSDIEGKIVKKIHNSLKKYDGIIINAGAYSHTSIAILDALKCVNIPTIEVHITDINNREEFRKFSYISLFANACISGYGIEGYNLAIDSLIKIVNKKKSSK